MRTNIILLIISAVLLSSCTKIIEAEQIYLNYSSYTFNCIEETVTIKVNSNAEWRVEGGAEWLSVGTPEGDEVDITAYANNTGEIREATLTFIAGEAVQELSLTQLYQTFEGKFADINDVYTPVFSRNGRYYASFTFEYLDDGYSVLTTPVIVDTYTGERTELEASANYLGVSAVSDDGKTVVIDLSSGGMGGSMVYSNGTLTEVSYPGFSSVSVSAISADGSIMVGYGMDKSTWAFVPIKWTNLQPELLQVPDVNSSGEELYNGAMARGCSADGSVIYGSEWDTMGLIYWKNGEMFYPGLDFAQKKTVIIEDWWGEPIEVEVTCTIKKTAEPYSISHNGRYIAATFEDYTADGDGMNAISGKPVIIDTETGEAFIIETDLPDACGIAADDNGMCYGGTPSLGVMKGYVFDYRNSKAISMSEWMLSKYGVVVDDDRLIIYTSKDQNVIAGWKATPSMLGVNYMGWYYIQDLNK